MAKFRIYHQVTIDEYLASQEDLFPDEKVSLAALAIARPQLGVSASAPVFPAGAIDGIGAAPGVSPPLQVVRSFGRKKMSG